MSDPQTTTSYPYRNLTDMLRLQAAKYGKRELMRSKHGGIWVSYSWNDTLQAVREFGLGLYAIGIRKGDKVGLLSENRPEWGIGDFAIMSVGAVTVPMYITSSAEQIAYYIKKSEVSVLIVSNQEQLHKVLSHRESLRQLKGIITLMPLQTKSPIEIFSYQDIREKGRQNIHLEKESSQFEACQPADMATIIFTSGTTDDPKGVCLSHQNILSDMFSTCEYQPFYDDTVYLSFLPLSHAFERVVGLYINILCGSIIVYSSGMEELAHEIVEVRPTEMVAVPRFFEKIYNTIWKNGTAAGSFKRILFLWSVKVGRIVVLKKCQGKKISVWLWFQKKIADRLLYNKIYKRLGGRIRFIVSGGAPLSQKIAHFFYAAYIMILEGYGLSEASPVVSLNSKTANRFGTVGRPIRILEIKSDQDDEILLRGPSVMMGYYKDPEATQQKIDKDGWLHTGDIGQQDADGYLRIADRTRNIIVLSSGKKVAPQPIEDQLITNRYIEQVMLTGEGKSYITALIVPDQEALTRYLNRRHITLATIEERLNSEIIRHLLLISIDRVNRKLASHEKIRDFKLLPEAFTEERGELTPTLKLKRRVIREKYKETIESMYP